MTSDTRSATSANWAHAARRSSFVLTIWEEAQTSQSPVWRGYLETADGDRRYFIALADLTALLRGYGWNDPPNQSAVPELDPIKVG